MKKKGARENRVKFLFSAFVWILIIGLCIAFGFSRDSAAQTTKRFGISGPSLSPDNKTIVFQLNEVDGPFYIAFYDIATKKLRLINPTGKDCFGMRYSADGKQLVFASGEPHEMNIFMMNLDGSGLRQLTHSVNEEPESPGPAIKFENNAIPSFSPDGKKLLFIRSAVLPERTYGGQLPSGWDVYEIDLASRTEKRLTRCRFHSTGRPYYLPDGSGFIFSGVGGDCSPVKGGEVFVMREGEKRPQRAFGHLGGVKDASIARNGVIAFYSLSNNFGEEKGQLAYDIFIRDKNITKQLTSEKFAIIGSLAISFDGSAVVFSASKDYDDGPELWMAARDGSSLVRIGRPWRE